MEESTTSKNHVMEMMARRDRERKLIIEKNQRARQEKSELEGVDHFEATFENKSRELENKIDALDANADVKTLQEEFTFILNELKHLQNYFTSSTIFLSEHKIKTCQNIINQLLSKCDEKKTISIPKKKFGFKNKSSKSESKVDEEKVEIAKNEVAPRNKIQWTESQKSNALLTFESESVNEKDLTFEGMENCVIIIKGNAGSLQLSRMKNCLVVCGPVARSIFADYCENCTFTFTCQQLRLHTSSSCAIYIRVTSRAIIEDCKGIQFAPDAYSYGDYEKDMDAAGLDKKVNNWSNVGDFNWLSTDLPSPYWSVIQEDDRIVSWETFIDNFIKKHNIN